MRLRIAALGLQSRLQKIKKENSPLGCSLLAMRMDFKS
jgi:hypothetical protein